MTLYYFIKTYKPVLNLNCCNKSKKSWDSEQTNKKAGKKL